MNSLFRILPDNLTNISIREKSNKNIILNNSTNISKENSKKKDIKDIKYWEYGNSGLKIKNFNKIMGKNLAILYYLDKTFQKFISNEKISIKKIFNKNFKKTFNLDSHELICLDGTVTLNLSHNKISGKYQLVEAGTSIISDVKILPEELTKFKVPELTNILDNLDNIKLIIKLSNILNLYHNFTMYDDVSNQNFNLYKLIINSLEIINNLRSEDKEKKFLKSNSKTAFYIKIYETRGKAFVIDSSNKLIYYICSTEFDNKIIFNYYVFNIEDNWLITKSVQ